MTKLEPGRVYFLPKGNTLHLKTTNDRSVDRVVAIAERALGIAEQVLAMTSVSVTPEA